MMIYNNAPLYPYNGNNGGGNNLASQRGYNPNVKEYVNPPPPKYNELNLTASNPNQQNSIDEPLPILPESSFIKMV